MKLDGADFLNNSFHDCRIWGLAFFPPQKDPGYQVSDLRLDIDYIKEWIRKDNSFEFVVYTATLVFLQAWKVTLDHEIQDFLQIDEISRELIEPLKGYKGPQQYKWTLSCHHGEIIVCSPEAFLFKRSPPKKIKHQTFSLEERGGISFELDEKSSL